VSILRKEHISELKKRKKLEKHIASIKISKPYRTTKKTEDQSLPFIVGIFRKLMKDDMPPTQSEFIAEFRKQYPQIKSGGITSRLKRFYLSYIREYHLYFILKRHFKTVIYDEELDLNGVDYVVYYKRHKFNIHAFVNTKNGKYWRKVKNNRHNFKGRHVDIPMNFDEGYKCGDIFLYTDKQVEHLKKKMEKILLVEKKHH